MDINNTSLQKILAQLKIKALNDMQFAAFTTISNNDNTILLSPTGSGKTLAFLLPLLHAFNPAIKKTQALIVTPSRELAQQIELVFKKITTDFKVTCCYGGHLRETEENNLVEPPVLLIGTPGRLGDHIRRCNITTDFIKTIVLDEFDKSLELGFQNEMNFIIQSLPDIKKRILTSATDMKDIPAFIGSSHFIKLNFLPQIALPAEKLAIKKVLSPVNDKADTLFKLICFLGNRSTIVFCNHREAVERTANLIKEKGITNVYYHGAMEQRDRDVALSKFRNGSVNVLITTDLAARGLDIPNIRYIIHYHIPHTEDSFIHRNGRTARMDASGTAIIILAPDEKMPEYIANETTEITLPSQNILPEKPIWTTVFIGAGKKDKINKVDIVGFLTQKAELKKEDIGLIDVKDFFSFAAVRKTKLNHALQLIKNEKIKNKKIKIDVAK
jgi:superfamily II DNA/RNA helicase